MQRTLTIHFPEGEQLAAVRARVGQQQIDTALGYMSLWGSGDDRIVETEIMFRDEHGLQPELLAVYRDANYKPCFVMGAVWSGELGKFLFHS